MTQPTDSLPGVEADSKPSRQKSSAAAGHRITSLIGELRQRSRYSEAASNALAFMELVATHGSLPESLQSFRQALNAALSPRLGVRQRADRIRSAASLLVGRPRRETWAVAVGLLLREYAASLDARPEERMELIQLYFREMDQAPLAINAAIPRLAVPPKQSVPTLDGLTELIDAQVQALCMSALHEAADHAPVGIGHRHPGRTRQGTRPSARWCRHPVLPARAGGAGDGNAASRCLPEDEMRLLRSSVAGNGQQAERHCAGAADAL